MAQLMVGTKADGKRDIRTVYGKTRGECQKKLEELRRRRDEGSSVIPARARRRSRHS